MFRVAVIAFALAVCSGPVMAEQATSQQAKKGHSFEECQARARATGNKWMGTNGRHFSNPHQSDCERLYGPVHER